MVKNKISFLVGIFICIFIFCKDSWAAQDAITVGRVSGNLSKAQSELRPFIDYVAGELKHLGIKQGNVIIAKNNQDLVRLVKEGKIDIVTETPFSALYYCDQAGMNIILRRWKKGASFYHSVFFVKKDSKINSLDQLKGKVIAFEDPGSTTGYFLPKVELIKKGFKLVALNNYKEKPSPDKIGYCFAKNELNIAHWLQNGLVAAGAFNNLEFEEPEGNVPNDLISGFRIIYETQSMPRNLILVRGDMDPKLQSEIKNVLMGMDKNEQGRKVMWNMLRTTKFDDLSESVKDFLKNIRELYASTEKSSN